MFLCNTLLAHLVVTAAKASSKVIVNFLSHADPATTGGMLLISNKPLSYLVERVYPVVCITTSNIYTSHGRHPLLLSITCIPVTAVR